MSRYDKHINKGESITIDNEEWILKAAGTDKVAKHYFNLMKAFKDMKTGDDNAMKMFDNFDDTTSDSVRLLIEETLTVSYPNEDEAKMKVFAMQHLMELLPVVINLYSPPVTNVESKKKQMLMDKIKGQQDELHQQDPK